MFKKNKTVKSTNIIGIMGSSRGVGTTQFSIMLAGFLSSKKQMKTAIVELNETGAFSEISALCFDDDLRGEACVFDFRLKGIDYYCEKTVKDIADIYQLGYDFLIIDFASDWEQNYYEWLRCNVSCLVGNCAEWKVSLFEQKISCLKQKSVINNFCILSCFGEKQCIKEIEKKYQIKIFEIPFIRTPFLLHNDSFTFFEQLCSQWGVGI